MVDEEAVKENKNGTEVPKMEPSEIDPCIEFNKKSGRRKFFENTERHLREKSGLSRAGLYVFGGLFLLVFALLITVTVLAATWPKQPHHQQYPICNDPPCLLAASQVQEAMNSSISPCKDVWAWACGGWLSKHQLPLDRSIWSMWEQLQVQEAARVRDLVTTLPLPVHIGTVEWKMKHLYEACLEVDNVNADQARPLTTIISELGGWYILRNWNLEDFDPKFILKQLQVKYGVSPYFQVSVQPNPLIPGKNSITISPSDLGLPERSYYYTSQDNPIQRAYKQLIRDVVVYLSVTKIEAEKFGEDMFYYEKRIAEITPHSYELLNPVNTYNSIKLSELRITAASLPLQDILSAMFPESNVTEETEVIVTSVDYLTKVSQIAATTDRATFNSYVIWTLVRKYLPYLSSQFTLTVDSFHSELLGIRRSVPRWEKCANLVKDIMGLAVESTLESQNPIEDQTRTTINNIFKEINEAVQKKLQNKKISSELRRYLLNKISRLKLQIGLPDQIKQENYIKHYYTKLIVLKANLFESFKNGLNFKRKIEEGLLTSPRIEDRLVTHATQYATQISYAPALNTVIVPRAILTQFIFDHSYPSSILYGRLGVPIANGIISSILPYDSAWNANLRLLSPYHSIVNESHQSVNNVRSCLINFISKHDLGQPENSELTSLSVLKHLSAINVAHQALISHLSGQSHIHQPSLEKFEDSALFFLSYSQTQCSRDTTQRETYDSLVNHQLSHESQLQTSWYQIPEFQTSLECSHSKEEEQCSDIF